MTARLCPNCSQATLGSHPTLTRYSVAGPFPASYSVLSYTCGSCRHRVHYMGHSGNPLRRWGWSESDEALTGGPAVDPGDGATVVWAWCPVAHEDQILYDERVCQEVHKAKAAGHRVAMVRPDNAPLPLCSGVCDSMFTIPSKLLSLTSGPYSSIAADRAVRKAVPGAQRVIHFWPSPILDPAHYIPLTSDDGLRRLWSNHTRSQIEIYPQ